MAFFVCVGLVALVGAVFGRSIHYDFLNFDDPSYIYQNPAINQGLSRANIIWIFSHNNLGTWFPLTDLSHQLDWQLYGANAGGHHLTNVVLHAAAAVLLFLALRRLTGALWRSAFVAAVFAIHPLRVESVAWVVERKDVLSGFFFMLTLWAWAGHVRKQARPEKTLSHASDVNAAFMCPTWTPDYFLALIFFALGLLSKSMLVTMPCVLLLLDYWPLNRLPSSKPATARQWLRSAAGLVVEKIPFFLLSAVIAVVTIKTQHNAVLTAQNFTPFWRVGNALLACTDYIGHMVYPAGLGVAYSHLDTDPTPLKLGVSLLILSSLTVAAIAGRRRHPYLTVGWFWYLGMLLPVVDVMQAAHNARADRYTYLPEIGLTIALTWGLAEISGAARWCRTALPLAATGAVAVLAVAAFVQTGYWKNSETLWTRTIAVNPNNSFAYNTKGAAQANHGQWAEAIRQYRHALAIDPDYPDALVNLGIALVNQNQRDEGIRYFERALEINPNAPEAHYNLGDSLAALGKTDEAIQQFELALQNRPNYDEAHYDLGLNLGTEGKWDDARRNIELAFHYKIDDADARYVCGVAQAAQNKWPEAINLYQQALQLKPADAEARYRLGVALASQKKWVAAIDSLQQAATLAAAQGDASIVESSRAEINICEAASTNSPSQ